MYMEFNVTTSICMSAGYERCLASGLRCRREDVQIILGSLNPAAVKLRKSRRLRRRNYTAYGPNYIWHIDAYDKLKPFSINV